MASIKKLIKSHKKHEVCEQCNCTCNTVYFQKNFKNWTSGNKDIDKFIRNTQLSAHNNLEKVLEWIPYNRFYNIVKDKSRNAYIANWVDGNIRNWNDKNRRWERKNQFVFVTLKILNNPKSIMSDIMFKV